MYPTISLRRKIEQLRKLEEQGYSITYYLLMDEKLATETLKVALLEVSNDNGFFELSYKAQLTILNKIITREVFRIASRKIIV